MGVDELSYFRELLTYMEESYRIDKKRIYCVGHSNGSKMTQALAKAMPEKFAAFGPTGSLAGYNPSEVEALNVKVPVPVWFMMGQYDINDPTVAPGSLAEKTLEAYCEANQMSPQFDNWYENGIYRTLIMYDGQHVPMVRYTVMKNCPHTYTAEMAQKTWDEFLCHFSREEDGSVSYRG